MELKFARSIKGRKGSKFTIKVFPEDTDEWHDYGDDLFPFVRLNKVPFFQLHYSKFYGIDISVRFFLRSTTLPVIFLVPCSHVNKPFAVLKSSFRRCSEYGC